MLLEGTVPAEIQFRSENAFPLPFCVVTGVMAYGDGPPYIPTLVLHRHPLVDAEFGTPYWRGIGHPSFPKRTSRAPCAGGPYIPIARTPSTPVFQNGPFAPPVPGVHISPSLVRHRPTPRFPTRTSRAHCTGAHIFPSPVRHRRPVFQNGHIAAPAPGRHISPTLVRHRPHRPS